jgi:hypothetical protein
MGFVSNSSSSSFYITNKSDKTLTLVDFVKENPQLIKQYLDRYWDNHGEGEYPDPYAEDDDEYTIYEAKQLLSNGYPTKHFTQKRMIEEAADKFYFEWNPREMSSCTFADDDGSTLGQVLRIILEKDGESKNFRWHFSQSNQ